MEREPSLIRKYEKAIESLRSYQSNCVCETVGKPRDVDRISSAVNHGPALVSLRSTFNLKVRQLTPLNYHQNCLLRQTARFCQ